MKERNNGTWTEAQYWGAVRSALRRGFRYWKPALAAKEAAKRKYNGPNKLQRWEYQCASCEEWFKGSEVEIDHRNPVGSLRCSGDLRGFLERLTPEDGFQLLCKKCHTEKTNKERACRKKKQKN